MRKIQFLIIAILFGYSFSAIAQTNHTFTTADCLLFDNSLGANEGTTLTWQDVNAKLGLNTTNIITSAGQRQSKTAFTITINSGITSIDRLAFADFLNLDAITLPNSVTGIGYGGFSNCGLTEIIFPSNVVSIEEDAFNGCSNLTTLTFEGTVPPTFGVDVFAYCSALTTIYVPNGLQALYASALSSAGITGITIKADPSTIILNPNTILRIGGSLKVGKGTKVIIGPP